jgi:hypothetical protein
MPPLAEEYPAGSEIAEQDDPTLEDELEGDVASDEDEVDGNR